MLENLRTAVGSGLSTVAVFLPKLVLFLVVLLVGWLVATLLRKACNAVLERVGFDRAVERGGVSRALAKSKYDASDLIAALVYYAVLLMTLQLAFGVFGPNPISDLPRLAVAVLIIVIAAAIAAAVKDLVMGALGGLSYGRMLATAVSVFIIGLGVIAALSQIGVAVAVTLPVLITVLATVAGILVVGVGGGLVRPMQQRWERMLTTAEAQAPQARAHAAAFQRGREDADRFGATGDAPQDVTEDVAAYRATDAH